MAKRPESITGNYEIALDAAAKGHVCIPILAGSKTPAVKWKRWQTEKPTEELYWFWFGKTRHSIAVITSGMVVFDCDDLSKVELVLKQCGDTPHKLRTPHGIHLGYRKRMGTLLQNAVKIKGMDVDIRTDGGLEMIPNSPMPDGMYRWLGEGLRPISELPVARIGWTRERMRRRVQPTIVPPEEEGMARRARAYLSNVEGAISGQRGHNKTFRVACKLTHWPPVGFGLSVEEAFPLLKEWSEISCEPPWSDAELLHKLSDAMKHRQ